METALILVLVAGLAAICVEDWRRFRIPDALSLPLVTLGLVRSALVGNLWAAAIGAVAAYLLFVAVEIGFRRLAGYDGLGRGDAKLFAVAGAWFGWQALPMTLLLASASGLAAGLLLARRDAGRRVPFAPFLTLGILSNLVL